MLISRNVFGAGGFDLVQNVIAPYLWQKKIGRIDYLLLSDRYGLQSKKLQFMIDTFHPREVLSSLTSERTIGGTQIEGRGKEGIALRYRGWSFLLSEQGMKVVGEQSAGREGYAQWYITKGRMLTGRSPRVLNLAQSGAITITVDPEGGMRMKNFQKNSLPLAEGGC